MKNLLLVLMVLPTIAFAGDSEGHAAAESVCKYIGGADTIIRCNRVISSAKVLQKDAVEICKYIGGADSVIECLQAVSNRTYSATALSSCKYIGGAQKVTECLGASGTLEKVAHSHDDEAGSSPRDLIRKALRQMDAGNYGKARETLQKALEH
jgi:hypothetical protein